MKKIIYLIQGKASNVLKYVHLNNEYSDLMTLTYDRDIYNTDYLGNIFLPNSSWAQGRNTLLATAERKKYDYFIFLDDDVQISKGSFQEFESLLLKHMPTFAVPLSDSIKNSYRYDPNLLIQRPIAFDQIFQAYHTSVLDDSTAIPYDTNYDHLSWWYSCLINEYLTLRDYYHNSLQFNTIETINTHHEMDCDNLSDSSTYKGGVDPKFLTNIKHYLVVRYGSQKPYVNSLFHDSRTPKIIYMPTGKNFLIHLFKAFITINLWQFGRLLFFKCYSVWSINWHKNNNLENLLKFEIKS